MNDPQLGPGSEVRQKVENLSYSAEILDHIDELESGAVDPLAASIEPGDPEQIAAWQLGLKFGYLLGRQEGSSDDSQDPEENAEHYPPPWSAPASTSVTRNYDARGGVKR